MTYLELVNAVLRKMRRATVTTLDGATDTRVLLAMEYVNDAKRLVEDAWNWNVLRQTIQITTTSGTYAYALTGAGNRYRLLKEVGSDFWAVINQTQDSWIRKAPSTPWMTYRLLQNNVASNQPTHFDINGQDGNGDPLINFWPIPDAAYTINVDLIIPQDDFTSDDDALTVPSDPVKLYAVAFAIDERGDDMGAGLATASETARVPLADAIALDVQKTPEEVNFYIY